MAGLNFDMVINPIVKQIEEQAEQQYGSFAKREPVVLGHLLASPALGLATLLAPGHPAALASQITAGAVALIVAVQGFAMRKFVAPAWKRATGMDLPSEVLDEPDPDPDDDEPAEHAEPISDAQEARLAGKA